MGHSTHFPFLKRERARRFFTAVEVQQCKKKDARTIDGVAAVFARVAAKHTGVFDIEVVDRIVRNLSRKFEVFLAVERSRCAYQEVDDATIVFRVGSSLTVGGQTVADVDHPSFNRSLEDRIVRSFV
jgi:hypothetical protein